ncbi:MAG: GlxA family transcriptional regulator [Rhodobacteraceae bacterium]|nr:GlxA family transcriptional regulator [Paracoccaceae bacterium]
MLSATNHAKYLDIAVLVLDESNTLSFAAAVDPLRAANRRAGRTLFRWRFFTPQGTPIHLTSGLPISGPPLSDLARADLLVVVASFGLEPQSTPRLLASLRRLAKAGTPLAALDGGPWLLAEAGLLDGTPATTHWEDLDAFAARFPEVDVRRDRFVLAGNRATSGGAVPGIDMMLALIADHFGAPLATRTAAALLHDPSPASAQSPAPPRRAARRNPQIARALDLMETHIDDPLPIAEIAARLGISPRSLEARFRQSLGQSPQSHYLELRLGEAFRLATDTNDPVSAIAAATGFNSQASFARAFHRAHGQSVRALRRDRP